VGSKQLEIVLGNINVPGFFFPLRPFHSFSTPPDLPLDPRSANDLWGAVPLKITQLITARGAEPLPLVRHEVIFWVTVGCIALSLFGDAPRLQSTTTC
jgi:hypothetical protein